MTSRKVTIVAGFQFASAVLAAIIGYGVMIPRYGGWGVAFSSVALALCMYWAAFVAVQKWSNRRADT